MARGLGLNQGSHVACLMSVLFMLFQAFLEPSKAQTHSAHEDPDLRTKFAVGSILSVRKFYRLGAREIPLVAEVG